MNKVFSYLLVALIGLGLGFFLNAKVFNLKESSEISLEKASQRALDYINEYLLRKNYQATLVEKSFDEKSGLYKIKFKVKDQEIESYISKNGRYLFLEGIDLTLSPEEKELKKISKREKPEVMLFVMSYCPFGNQAEEAIYPVVNLLKNKVEVEPHYVIYQNYMGGSSDYCLEKGKYCSMHGIEELKEDLRELCIYKYEKEKFWDFLIEVNKKCNLKNIATCWKEVAKNHQIDISKIETCQDQEGITFLEKEVALNKKYQVAGSPTLIINGTNYQGQRTPEAFKKAICYGFENPPQECQKELEKNVSAPSGSCR